MDFNIHTAFGKHTATLMMMKDDLGERRYEKEVLKQHDTQMTHIDLDKQNKQPHRLVASIGVD